MVSAIDSQLLRYWMLKMGNDTKAYFSSKFELGKTRFTFLKGETGKEMHNKVTDVNNLSWRL